MRTTTAMRLGLFVITGTLLLTATSPVIAQQKIRESVPVVTYSHMDTLMLNNQADIFTVVTDNLKSKSVITVEWGDGTNSTRAKNNCNKKKSRERAPKCAKVFTHYFSQTGTFTIFVKQDEQVVSLHLLTVEEQPMTSPSPLNTLLPWTAPLGWTQPNGWSVINGGGTFLPCSTIRWYFDREGELGSRSEMINLIQPALEMVSAQTGLTFTQTGTKDNMQLEFSWMSNMEVNDPNIAGTGGGGLNANFGSIELNPYSWWTANQWAGFEMIKHADWAVVSGNGWLIIHEVLHVLGLGHTEDPSQIMYFQVERSSFGSGDIEGMHTMYLNQPCN